MEDTSSDESVSQFMAITGSADANQARSYLEMSGNDLQTAISLFLEHQGGGSGIGGGSSSSGMGGAGFGAAVGIGDGDVRAPDATQRMRLLDYDDGAAAAMGRMGAGLMDHPLLGPHAAMMGMGMGGYPGVGGGDATGGGGGGMNAFADDEDMEDVHDSGLNVQDVDGIAGAVATAGGGNVSLRDVMNRAASDSSAGTGAGVGAAVSSSSMANDAVGSSSAMRLSAMFAPPDHLTHRAGGFQGARNFAKDTRRWLLVNIQSDSDFACHALNRDVWRDELVENLVREGYIFWQSLDTNDDGRTYCERYNVSSFPHIGIIDPRTARLMYRKEGWTQENPMTPEAFAEIAADFCSRHSFDKAPVAPKIGGAGASSGATSNGSSTSRSARVDAMTEEEQLQAAIRASMNDAPQNDDSSVEYVMEDDDDDDDDNDDEDNFDNDLTSITAGTGIQSTTATVSEPSTAAASAAPPRSEPTFMEQIIAMEVGDEPTANAARIMIRMPDGKRLVRKFKKEDDVKTIYAFVGQSNEDAKGGKEFVMKAGFPPKDLVDSIDKSIENTGLAGDSITVRWKED